MKTPLTDEYLKVIDGIQDAEPKPFFYTRLKARMEKKAESYSIWQPSFAFALSVVLVFNIYFLKSYEAVPKNTNPAQAFTNGYELNAAFNY